MTATTPYRPKTRDVAGCELKLVEGRRYVAAKPTPSRNARDKFDVPILDTTEGYNRFDAPAAVIAGLSRDAAVRLRDQFNVCPFGGRAW